MSINMNIMCLFDSTDSSLQSTPRRWSDSEIQDIMTPCRTGDNSSMNKGDNCGTTLMLVDEDSGLGMETVTIPDALVFPSMSSILSADTPGMNGSITEFSLKTPASRPFKFIGAKKSLFAEKRLCGLRTDVSTESPSPICLKKGNTSSTEQRTLRFALANSPSFNETRNIIRAVDMLTNDDDLIADGSHGYSLPTITGKHSDLKSISADTMAEVLLGKHTTSIDNITIVDCRYPYEFEGGHIREAVNLYTKDAVHKLIEPKFEDKHKIFIFHCEFSSERGPKMYRFLRSQDREFNKDSYPKLNFPEVYLLEGGYKSFYHTYPSLCDPIAYKPMLHENHAADLRHFRVKSKSWTSGQPHKQQQQKRRIRSCLSFKY